jgi:hypothetical protein
VYVYDIEVCAPTVPPGCETVTLTITVIDPTDTDSAPVANTDNYIVLAEEDVSGNVLDNDINLSTGNSTGLTVTALNSDTDLDPITLGGGTLTLLADGSFELIGADVPGTYSFTYTVEDADGNEATATVYITVYPLGSANVVLAADDYKVTEATVPVSGNVLTNDTQLSGNPLTLVTNPGTYPVVGKGSLLLNADGTYTFTPIVGFVGSVNFIYTTSGDGGATASATLYITVTYPPLYVWTGDGVLGDWCDPDNWDRGLIPTAGADILLEYNASNPEITFDGTCITGCIKNLTIESGVILNLTNDLCVTGDLVSAGVVKDVGYIILEGTTPQTITGDFNIDNLELNNPTGATITAGAGNMVNIIGELLLTDGFLTTNTNLTLKSTSTGSAYLGPIADCDDAGLIGNVRVEVYVAGTNRAFRFFGHFFNHTISLQQIRNVIDITGNGLDFNDTGNPSAFWYNTLGGDQRSDVDAEDIGWVPFTSATLANWQRYQGVRVMVRGPKAQTNSLIDTNYIPDPVTFTWIGQLNTCEQTIYLTWSGTPGGGAAGDSKWNLVANPFAAPLDMGTVGETDRNTAGSSFYVWEPRRPYASGSTFAGYGPGGGRAGRYRAVPFSSGDVQERTLPIGSAFFISSEYNTVNPGAPSPNTSGSITFRENQKLRSTTPGYAQPDAGSLFRTEEIKSYYGMNSLQLLITEGQNELDRVIVMFKEEAEGVLEYWDGTKMANDDMNFFTVSKDDWALAVDSRKWEEGDRFPLHILAPNGNFKVTVPDFDLEAGRVAATI